MGSPGVGFQQLTYKAAGPRPLPVSRSLVPSLNGPGAPGLPLDLEPVLRFNVPYRPNDEDSRCTSSPR